MKLSKNKHFIFVLLLMATVVIYPLIMMYVPIYKIFSCNKDANVCEYIEYNIYKHELKKFNFKINLNVNEKPLLIVHESYHGSRVRYPHYQLSLYYHGIEYKLFSRNDQKKYIDEIKDRIIHQLNNETNRYVQISEGDPNANFGIYFFILILFESSFYYLSYLIINMKKKNKTFLF